MTPSMFALILAGVKAASPWAIQMLALARAEGQLSDEQKAQIDADAELTDNLWAERAAEVKARLGV